MTHKSEGIGRESGQDQTELDHVGRGERGTRVAAARRPKVTKMSGLYREGPLAKGQ